MAWPPGLCAPDAVLWGTLSPTLRQGPAAVCEYFVGAFKALPGHKVSFVDQLIRVYGETAINAGYYTFPYVKDVIEASQRNRDSWID